MHSERCSWSLCYCCVYAKYRSVQPSLAFTFEKDSTCADSNNKTLITDGLCTTVLYDLGLHFVPHCVIMLEVTPVRNQTIGSHQHQMYSNNMRSEKERLKTFTGWPVEYLDPNKLASSGFYYTKYGDEIRCAFCGIQLSDWEHGYDPVHFHKICSSDCDFLKQRDCGNIPIANGTEADEPSSRTLGLNVT